MSKETATLAGGCFWCTEAIFKRLRGVVSVTPGYAGGAIASPTYEQVSSGKTGHAEAIQIAFDPEVISFAKILDIFWHTHDPTTMNRQGNDVGPQYRSEIFYHTGEQKLAAEQSERELELSNYYHSPIVTKITPFTNFYPAENYHKNYYEKNSNQPYCTIVINPKIRKLLNSYKTEVNPQYLN